MTALHKGKMLINLISLIDYCHSTYVELVIQGFGLWENTLILSLHHRIQIFPDFMRIQVKSFEEDSLQKLHKIRFEID